MDIPGLLQRVSSNLCMHSGMVESYMRDIESILKREKR